MKSFQTVHIYTGTTAGYLPRNLGVSTQNCFADILKGLHEIQQNKSQRSTDSFPLFQPLLSVTFGFSIAPVADSQGGLSKFKINLVGSCGKPMALHLAEMKYFSIIQNGQAL